jgi:hypothetical protein
MQYSIFDWITLTNKITIVELTYSDYVWDEVITKSMGFQNIFVFCWCHKKGTFFFVLWIKHKLESCLWMQRKFFLSMPASSSTSFFAMWSFPLLIFFFFSFLSLSKYLIFKISNFDQKIKLKINISNHIFLYFFWRNHILNVDFFYILLY